VAVNLGAQASCLQRSRSDLKSFILCPVSTARLRLQARCLRSQEERADFSQNYTTGGILSPIFEIIIVDNQLRGA
jgi:hypothetical protein